MSALAATWSDTLVLARRNLMRIPRQPDLLIAYTVQPVMFVLLFVYVFGGAISTPGFDYVDFLMPGIIVQSIAFGGFVTALGLSEDVQKGLIDRFRSLPMSRAAVLLGPHDVGHPAQLPVAGRAARGRLRSPGSTSTTRRRGRSSSGSCCCCSWATRSRGSSRWSACTRRRRRPRTRSGSRCCSRSRSPRRCSCRRQTMPDGLRQFAEANPFTTFSDAIRSLWLGTPPNTRRLDVVRLVRRADGGLRAARRGALPEGRREVTIIEQVTAPGALPDDREALDSYSRVITYVAETLAPSVANLRVGRRGGGSGVVITPDGFVLTNAHVVGERRAPRVVASFTDGRELSAELVGSDPLTDLALLRTERATLDPGRARRRRGAARRPARGRDRQPARVRRLGHRGRRVRARALAAGRRRRHAARDRRRDPDRRGAQPRQLRRRAGRRPRPRRRDQHRGRGRRARARRAGQRDHPPRRAAS